jgi:hypothetical protein
MMQDGDKKQSGNHAQAKEDFLTTRHHFILTPQHRRD